MTSPSKDTPAGDDEIKQTHADVTLYYFTLLFFLCIISLAEPGNQTNLQARTLITRKMQTSTLSLINST